MYFNYTEIHGKHIPLQSVNKDAKIEQT